MADFIEVIVTATKIVEVIGEETKIVEIVIPGPQGPEGIPGPSSSGDVFATRAALVAAVAGGLTRADGNIAWANGQAYMFKSGATMLPSLAGLVPAFDYTVEHFGAVGDGTTADQSAIQSAINAVSTNGGGPVRLNTAIYAVSGGFILKSGVWLKGNPRGSIIRPTAAFSATGYVIINQNTSFTDYTSRTDTNLGVDGIIFDGSLRPYVMYPTAGYTNQGGMILLMRCEQPFVRNCIFRDYRAGWAITSQGNRGAAFQDNEFLRLGKQDVDTGGILNISTGSKVRPIITAISKANPCVITFAIPHNFGTGIKYLRGIRGMTQLADGEYTITAVTSATVTLGAVNSTAYSDFVFDADAEMTDRYAMRSLGSIITGNRFNDLYRMALSDSGDGTVFTGNEIAGAGEAGVYSLYARNCVYTGNRIGDVALTDIVASGIEVNYGANHLITGNQFRRTEGNSIRISGMIGGRVSGNVCKEAGYTVGLVYPSAPEAASQGIVGAAVGVEVRALIFITNYDNYPVDNIDVSSNDLIDTRDDATRLTTFGIRVQRKNVDNLNKGLQIIDNRFRGLTRLTEADWISFGTSVAANGCWVEYQNPLTGRRITLDASGSGYQEFAAPVVFSGGVDFNGQAADDIANIITAQVEVIDAGAYATAAYWSTNNPVLLTGQLLFESDTGRAKLGNGVSTWSSLPYCVVPIWVQSTPPASPYLNQLWVDTA